MMREWTDKDRLLLKTSDAYVRSALYWRRAPCETVPPISWEQYYEVFSERLERE